MVCFTFMVDFITFMMGTTFMAVITYMGGISRSNGLLKKLHRIISNSSFYHSSLSWDMFRDVERTTVTFLGRSSSWERIVGNRFVERSDQKISFNLNNKSLNRLF